MEQKTPKKIITDWEPLDISPLKLTIPPNKLFMYSRTLEPANMEGYYAGRHCFLILSGPSLDTHDLSLLNQRGVLKFGVNNSWAKVKPDLWTAGDAPGRFIDVGWKDPTITKFVPIGRMPQKLSVRKPDGTFKKSAYSAMQMPACWFYPRGRRLNPKTFLTEPLVTWGRIKQLGNPSGLSVMLAAMKLSYYLGIRHLYLIGADFKMEEGKKNYAFEQDRTPQAVKNNQQLYNFLNHSFKELVPHFEANGFEVKNCTPGSGLTAFPYLPYEEAVKLAAAECGKPIVTEGYYNHERNPT